MLPVALFLVLLISTTASAQRREFVGPGKCTDCHDHRDEKEWSEKRDGDGKGKLHLNALNQLEEARAAQWAKAIGVSDVYDASGTCARCHATVVRGSAEFGVTCESCHGAGRDYLRPHQDKGAYAAAISLGMADVVKKPETWSRQCLSCHVLGQNPGDAALIKAGHPSGDQFDLSRKFATVALHWTSEYEPRVIAATLTSTRGPAVQTVSAPVAAPAPVSPPPLNSPVPSPSASRGSAPPAAAPPAASVAKPSASPGPPRPSLALAIQPPSLPPRADRAAPPVIEKTEAVLEQTPAAIVGSVQGRVIALLESILEAGVRTPVRLTPPATTTTYRGADAELLRLQSEVIALALEALGTAPSPKPAPQ